jgi:hypothetical protein
MTWKHAFIVCFALLLVAVCGFSANCQPNMGKLGDLALVAIGAVSGNAMNEVRHSIKRKNKQRKTRSNGK